MEQETRRERQTAGIAAKSAGVYLGRRAGTTKAQRARAHQLREKGLTVPEISEAMGVSGLCSTIWRTDHGLCKAIYRVIRELTTNASVLNVAIGSARSSLRSLRAVHECVTIVAFW
jgi:hypothetical protein